MQVAQTELAEAQAKVRMLQLSEVKLEGANAEASAKIERLSESVKAAEMVAASAKRAASDAERLIAAERDARGRAERKAAELERSAQVHKQALESLRRDYEGSNSSLKRKTEELEAAQNEQLKISREMSEMEGELKRQLADKDQENVRLRQQLAETQISALSDTVVSEAVKKATADLQASFEARIPRIKTEGAREWRDTEDYVRAMEEHNGMYLYAMGASWVRSELKRTQSLDLNNYRINDIERMTVDGMTLYRKKNFPFPINLPDTPSDMLEGHIVEYEYKNSKMGPNELEGLPEDLYIHLGLKHQKIKAYQQNRAPLDLNDPDLFYDPAPQTTDPSATSSEIPATPLSTPSSLSDESSSAGLSPEEEGEEVDGAQNAASEVTNNLASEIMLSAAEKLLEEMADRVMARAAEEERIERETEAAQTAQAVAEDPQQTG